MRKQYKLFPLGPVIKCFSSDSIGLEKGQGIKKNEVFPRIIIFLLTESLEDDKGMHRDQIYLNYQAM